MISPLANGTALRAVALALLAAGCDATPPSLHQGTLPPVADGNFATIARCSRQTPCPGDACSDNAVGPPDGKAVDLASCGTLDVVFTGGNVLAVVDQPDLAIVIQGPLAGQTQIEASADGVDYVVVGFLNQIPPQTPQQCLARIEGSRALVDVAHCNLISNVSFLRLSFTQQAEAESVTIDAIEALSFQPR